VVQPFTKRVVAVAVALLGALAARRSVGLVAVHLPLVPLLPQILLLVVAAVDSRALV